MKEGREGPTAGPGVGGQDVTEIIYKKARMRPVQIYAPFSLLFSIKIHDLTELRDMYAIINLDDENKGIDLAEASWYFVVVVGKNHDSCVLCILVEGIKIKTFP